MIPFAEQGLDATSLAQRIIDGSLSCSALTEAVIARYHAVNPTIQAVCMLDPELARQLAERNDHTLRTLNTGQRAALALAQPFFGIPSLLKDLGTADPALPSRMGSAYFGEVRFDCEADLVTRYKKAGIALIGRTTSSELGLSPTSESTVYGAPTRNPWHLGHSAGGSSGGAGAAVAAGIVPMAHGGDGGGSIRIPAACNQLVGLKTSRGVTPFGPTKGESWGGMVTEHMLTVSVRDCAIALDHSAGASLGAPYAAPAFARSFAYAAECGHRAGLTRPLRVAVASDYVASMVDSSTCQAYTQFVEKLRLLGCDIVEVAYPVTAREVMEHAIPVIAQNAYLAIETHRAKHPEASLLHLQKTVLSMVRYAKGMPASQYIAHINAMHGLTRRLEQFFYHSAKVDLLAIPVLARVPAPLGQYAMDWEDYEDYRLGPNSLLQYSPFTTLANATGLPAIALPHTQSAQGIPLGMQLMAPFGQDDVLLEVAAAYEMAFPWQRYAPNPLAA